MDIGARSGHAVPGLLDRRFRAHPEYDLAPFERLSEKERRQLAEVAAEPGFYGILRPRSAKGLAVRSVDRDTALLFLTLREPGPLPFFAREALGAAAFRTVARLVADGILEVEHGGSFVSGADALDLMGSAPAVQGEGRIAMLSLAALRAAQALPVADPSRLGWFLYAYNRLPLTPGWRRRLASPGAVESHLGIGTGGPHRERLLRAWSPSTAGGWLSWRARDPERRAPRSGPTYKLYISPLPEALAAGFGDILDAITAARACSFKVGADALGLLRPDKIVAYFHGFERLAAAAETVRGRLDGVPVQGVPFTSEIAGDGLISWGVDPPRWEGGESWRMWLAQRLARAIVAARQGSMAGAEPFRFALERIRLEGVDTTTWTPGSLLWREDEG